MLITKKMNVFASDFHKNSQQTSLFNDNQLLVRDGHTCSKCKNLYNALLNLQKAPSRATLVASLFATRVLRRCSAHSRNSSVLCTGQRTVQIMKSNVIACQGYGFKLSVMIHSMAIAGERSLQ